MGTPLIGASRDIIKIRELIDHVADTGLNVVIYGESGVGKEVVAQNLYEKSPRAGKPFIKINCAALPEGLLESELFGYEQGAFTGAQRRKKGKFELANKGVLLLDEIGDMSISLQAKLLHVLQGSEFSPLGSEKDIKSDTWIMASTNNDLDESIKNGTFREDLYYRLNIIKIYIPPLRKRPEDIPPLIDYYFKQYSFQLDKKDIKKPGKSIFDKLMKYHWPGNIRELQNVLKRMLALGGWNEIVDELTSGHLELDSMPPVKTYLEAPLIGINDLSSFSLKKIRKKAVDSVEKEVISHVLNETGWNRTKATKILKISYKTLLYKISELGIKKGKA